jgi:hypothetical protein
VVTRMGGGVGVPTAARARCGVGLLDRDVCAGGSECGTARDGRDNVADIVCGTKL